MGRPRRRRPRRRETAFRLFFAATEEGRWANRLAPALLSPLSPEDRRFVSHLVYTALRRLPLLDWKLQQILRGPMEKLDPEVRAALRLGACEIEEGHPPPPVVSAWVDVVKPRSPGGALLVNAVLRRYASRSFPPPPPWAEAGLPRWLFRRWARREAWHAMLWQTWLRTPPPLYIRINTLEGDLLALKTRIVQWYQAYGGRVEETPLPEALRVHPHPWEVHLPPSWYYLQDLSSMLVVHLLDPQPGERIWDVAAAPGGKTAHIVARTGGRGTVVATDVLMSRVVQTRKVLQRLGAWSSVRLLAADGRSIRFRRRFDRVLLDAPCSGLGPLRRKPEVLLRIRPSRLRELTRIQRDLLENAARHVRPGGVLVYATCTTEPEENTHQIEGFLRNHPEFEPLPLDACPEGVEAVDEGQYWIRGDVLNADFAFVARLRRRA